MTVTIRRYVYSLVVVALVVGLMGACPDPGPPDTRWPGITNTR